jgi:hypothetical protein
VWHGFSDLLTGGGGSRMMWIVTATESATRDGDEAVPPLAALPPGGTRMGLLHG